MNTTIISRLTLLLTCVLSVFPQTLFSTPPNFPFPQHVSYVSGTILPNNVTQRQLDDSTASFYEQWKTRYLVNGCDSNQYYVFWNYEGTGNPANSISVSEGHGYGMLITAFMAGYDPSAKKYFDGLYRYFRAHPSVYNNYLMAWNQITGCIDDPNGGNDDATDGDLDIGYSLLLADKQWGSAGEINYLQEAKNVLHAHLQNTINPVTHSVLMGDWSNPDNANFYYGTRTSDFMLQHFKAFATASGNTEWFNVAEECYSLINTMQTKFSPTTGLLPDFIAKVNTTPTPPSGKFLESKTDGKYSYNACRDPWRIGIDYLLTGDERAKTALNKMNTFIQAKALNDPHKIRSGYSLKGIPIHNNFVDLPFLAPLAVGAMVDASNQQWLNDLWSYIQSYPLNDDNYFGNTLKMLSMITVSGNWWNPQPIIPEQTGRKLSFSGHSWSVKSCGDEICGPGPNSFSDSSENVYVDANGFLHLKITKRNNKWYCAEVYLDSSLGYGKYVFQLANRVDNLDQNVVLGLFTYDDTDTLQAYREIDVEYSRWGDPEDPTNAQFVVQPYFINGNLLRWTQPFNQDSTTVSFNWKNDSINFISSLGHQFPPPNESIISSLNYTGEQQKTPGNEKARMNLWLYQGAAPSNNQAVEVVISRFKFIPDSTSDPKFRTFLPNRNEYGIKAIKPRSRTDTLTQQNIGNILECIFNKARLNPGNPLLLGKSRNDSAKFYLWATYAKSTDVTKLFYGIHTGTPEGLSIGKKYGRKGPLKSPKYKQGGAMDNQLFANLVALKLNLYASDSGVIYDPADAFHYRLGNLIYNEPNSLYKGKTLWKIARLADSMLTYTHNFSGDEYVAVNNVITNINNAFHDTATIKDLVKCKFKATIKLSKARPPYFSLGQPGKENFSDVCDCAQEQPLGFQLMQNYPNPFNPATVIRFTLTANSSVSLKIFNILGEEVAILLNNSQIEAGEKEITFNAASLPTGIYFYRLNINNGQFVQTKKLMLLK